MSHAHTQRDRRTGRAYWRSLDELADRPEFRAWVEAEFPAGVGQLDGVSRRHFLKIMAASFALAGWVGCGRGPGAPLMPHVRAPRGQTPGRPLTFATALMRSGYARGVVVTSYEGRPTKIEGNPKHPASLGATDVFAQAEILTFYDPDRSQAVVGPHGVASWSEFLRELRTRMDGHRAQGGRGLRLLTGHITSPTLLASIERLVAQFPAMRWHVHEAMDDASARAGARRAMGQDAEIVYDLSAAERILALDCDFLFALPGSVRYARDFAAGRRPDGDSSRARAMNRLYVAEPTPTITGAKADHRLRLGPRSLPALVYALAKELGVPAGRGASPAGDARAELDPAAMRFVQAAARDLAEHPGRCAVFAGRGLPPDAHARLWSIHRRLDVIDRTVRAITPLCTAGTYVPLSLPELVQDIDAGAVETLLMIDVDPAYTAGADLRFAAALSRVDFAVHMGLYAGATGAHCRWHLPLAHELESWGDARAFDGTASILQPLIAPLYHGRSATELLALLAGDAAADAQSLVRAHWRDAGGAGDFEGWWRAALRDGVVPDSASPPLSARTGEPDTAVAFDAASQRDPATLDLVFQPGARTWDGRYANNAWLQESPDPITSVTWDNAALIAPATAARLGLRSEDVVRIDAGDARLEAPVYLLPGQAEGTVTLALGYGQDSAGHVATGVGCNAYRLRRSDAPWYVGSVQLRKTGRRRPLALTQEHHALEGRDLLRSLTLAEFDADRRKPGRKEGIELPQVSLYPQRPQEGRQWGMSIDLGACIGCGACTIACQAENNIPVVGKAEVRRGREMHWIRVDRYFGGAVGDPAIHHQPVPCMHCEKAPCELVCPTAATLHSHDGLNEMIYNRCIGTRYCSNNCPYKVRRFNFLRYADFRSETVKLQRNPEVSVRARGVMEKCTYCVQRIRTAEITARRADRPIADGELVTACQQACPTQAIVFGDVNDPDSAVSRAKRRPHAYAMLHELNTRPRTSYLAEVRNPNPALESGDAGRARHDVSPGGE